MRHAVLREPIAEFARDVGWTIVAQQPRPMPDVDLVQAGGLAAPSAACPTHPLAVMVVQSFQARM